MRITLALAALISACAPTAQLASPVENSIAGVVVGVSTIDDVRHKFGEAITNDQGRIAVRWDGQCELFFDLEDEDPHSTPRRIANVQLLNLGGGQSPTSPCAAIKTASGIGLSNSLGDVSKIYGQPTGRLLNHEVISIGYDNTKKLCLSSVTPNEIVVIRNFGVDWSNKKKAIQSISIGVTRATCEEFIEARTTP